MSEKSLTVRELINGGEDDFDPLSIDTGEIRKLSNAIPKDGNIDLNNAEVLATKYLRGADMCAELLAIATSFSQKTDALKKKAFGEAALVKSKSAGIKTDKSRAWFAEMDNDYIIAFNKHAEAVGFVKWVSNKYDSFIRAHYMCRNIIKRGTDHEGAAGWNCKTPDDNEGW